MKVPIYGMACVIIGFFLTEYSQGMSLLPYVLVWLATAGCVLVVGSIIEALIINRQWWGEDRYDNS